MVAYLRYISMSDGSTEFSENEQMLQMSKNIFIRLKFRTSPYRGLGLYTRLLGMFIKFKNVPKLFQA
jgi:hypothetical protein